MLLSHGGTHGRDLLDFLWVSRRASRRSRRGFFEDVRIVCGEDSGVLWSHSSVLGSASPFLKGIFLDLGVSKGTEEEGPHSLFLPGVRTVHMKKALEALYKGCIRIQGTHVLQPILDILRSLQCSAPLTELLQGEEEELMNEEEEEEAGLQRSSEGPLFVQALGEDSSHHKCVMCSKTFLHAQNLKIHLQSHLGLQVQLNKCAYCKRVFGRSLEYELHMNSHKHWRRLKPSSISNGPSSIILRTRKLLLKRSIDLLVKNHRRRNPPVTTTQSTKTSPEQPSPSAPEKKMLKLKIKNVSSSDNSSESHTSNVNGRLSDTNASNGKSSLEESTWCTICQRFYADLRGLKKHISRIHGQTPSGPKKRPSLAVRSPSSNRDVDLTCPTCDKVFVTTSIFQRHLKTSQHGSGGSSGGVLHTKKPQHHLNKVLQPTILLQGKETPKYECHLCKQVFLRVKDLAKHRAKMCSAWVNS